MDSTKKTSWDTDRDGYTDRSFREPLPNTCGSASSVGQIKFFCKTTTGDLGNLNEDPATPNGGWGVNNPETDAGSIPSTTTEPDWWNDQPVEGTASRSASSTWSCCCNVKTNSLWVLP